MTGKAASEEIAGKLSLNSLAVSHWQIRAELFQTRRFSGFCGLPSSIVQRKDQNPHFPVASWGNVLLLDTAKRRMERRRISTLT